MSGAWHRTGLLAPGGFFDLEALLQGLPPGTVRRVPLDRFAKAVLEADLGAPTQLTLDLRRVEQVAAVVAGPVGDDRLQGGRLAGELEHAVGDLFDRSLDARADVVGLALGSVLEHELDGAAV